MLGSLSTCDPGDVFATVQVSYNQFKIQINVLIIDVYQQECKKSKVRCSVIQLAAEVHLLKHLAHETEGSYL